MLLAGTVPLEGLEITSGTLAAEGENLLVNGRRVSAMQGTGAMLAAAVSVAAHLGQEAPWAVLAGDVGDGRGSRHLYRHLVEALPGISPDVLVLHYCLPNMGLMREFCRALGRCNSKPLLVADAGAMYAAKAAGLAQQFDVFTPDLCEVAFLADARATHPAYVSKHLFGTAQRGVPALAAAAYRQQNAPALLLVKGVVDYVVREGEVVATVYEPDVPELEAVGGTGDTITGVLAALVHAGFPLEEAALLAARANRTAGKFARTTPATKVWEIVRQLPAVFGRYL
jgi:hydroxymethylpyrimidine/phosphomethylpyrimidine kinase